MSRKRRRSRDARSQPTSGRPGESAAETAAAAVIASAPAGHGRSDGGLVAVAVVALLLFTTVALAPVLANGYLNWDDPDVLVHNPSLDGPNVIGWAFTTTHVGHYQPLSWLVWAAARRLLGDSPTVAHTLSLGLHLLNAVLVFLLTWTLGRISFTGQPRLAREQAVLALAAALLFALHPLRVEPLAWASALPYPLALLPLLLATLTYVRHATTARRSWPWLAVSFGLYGVSLLARPLAPGFFLVLLLLDVGLGRPNAARHERWRSVLGEKLPFALLGLAGAVIESGSRRFVGLEQVGPAERLAAATAAPFVYLGRTLWPLALTPLDPLPLATVAPWTRLGLAALGLALLFLLAVRTWRRHRAAWLLLLAYAVLLAPASGLAPSGLQATADRYTYAPGVPLSLLLAGALLAIVGWVSAKGAVARAPSLLLVGFVGIACGALSFQQARVWRDSITLWSHALAIDPRNDVALYNLATALAESGDEAGAAARYRELLALVPEHGPGLKNLALLEAKQRERRGNEAAAAGRLEEAERAYAEALARDPARLHSRASRAMALAQLDRCSEAIPELRTALEAGRDEPSLWGALAYCLSATGDLLAARATLDQALARHPGDPRLRATRDALTER